jgi:hypothetical protein
MTISRIIRQPLAKLLQSGASCFADPQVLGVREQPDRLANLG